MGTPKEKPDVVKLVSEEPAKLQAISERLIEFCDYVTVERFLGKETLENMTTEQWEQLANMGFYDELSAFQTTLEESSETIGKLDNELQGLVKRMKRFADEE